jgi:hypothetical protein
MTKHKRFTIAAGLAAGIVSIAAAATIGTAMGSAAPDPAPKPLPDSGPLLVPGSSRGVVSKDQYLGIIDCVNRQAGRHIVDTAVDGSRWPGDAPRYSSRSAFPLGLTTTEYNSLWNSCMDEGIEGVRSTVVVPPPNRPRPPLDITMPPPEVDWGKIHNTKDQAQAVVNCMNRRVGRPVAELWQSTDPHFQQGDYAPKYLSDDNPDNDLTDVEDEALRFTCYAEVVEAGIQ